MSSAAAPRVIPLDLYSAARTRYLKFIEALRPLVGREGDESFGGPMKPSQLIEMAEDHWDMQLEADPIRAISEHYDLKGDFDRHINQVIELMNSANAEITTMMEARGFTLTEFYMEYMKMG